jgi:hypothetical protein
MCSRGKVHHRSNGYNRHVQKIPYNNCEYSFLKQVFEFSPKCITLEVIKQVSTHINEQEGGAGSAGGKEGDGTNGRGRWQGKG